MAMISNFHIQWERGSMAPNGSPLPGWPDADAYCASLVTQVDDESPFEWAFTGLSTKFFGFRRELSEYPDQI